MSKALLAPAKLKSTLVGRSEPEGKGMPPITYTNARWSGSMIAVPYHLPFHPLSTKFTR